MLFIEIHFKTKKETREDFFTWHPRVPCILAALLHPALEPFLTGRRCPVNGHQDWRSGGDQACQLDVHRCQHIDDCVVDF